MKASDPRRKLGYCGFPVPRGPWVRVKWLEAVGGSRPMGLGTTEVTRLAWVSLLPFPPAHSRAVWTLHSYTSPAPHWAALSCSWPHHWNGFPSGPFPTASPVLHWRTRSSAMLMFAPIQVCRTPHFHSALPFPPHPQPITWFRSCSNQVFLF